MSLSFATLSALKGKLDITETLVAIPLAAASKISRFRSSSELKSSALTIRFRAAIV
jgi:hypothetical protein